MTKRRAMTPARRKRIAVARNWRTPYGEQLCLENGKVHLLATGKPPQYDHTNQLALSGDDSDENIRPLNPVDHKPKTAADAKVRAKNRRATGQNKKQPKRKIQSRPFGNSDLRKKFDGEVVPR